MIYKASGHKITNGMLSWKCLRDEENYKLIYLETNYYEEIAFYI